MSAASFAMPLPSFNSSPFLEATPRREYQPNARQLTSCRVDSLTDPVMSSSSLTTDSLMMRGWYKVLTSEADRIGKLRHGWDGSGSMPISKSVLFQAVQLTTRALTGIPEASAPYLVPGGDGTVQIEWHHVLGGLELDIGLTGSLSIWVRDHNAEVEFEGEDDRALDLFYRWAPRLSSRVDNGADARLSAARPFFSVAA